MVQCIGSMGDGWFAELDFDHNEATVLERGKGGRRIGPIATVPIGAYEPETDEYDPKLCNDEQNRRLMNIVAVPRTMAALRYAQSILKKREDREPPDGQPYTDWREDMQVLREVEQALEWASTVPE